MPKIDKILKEALSRKSSDVHFASGEPVRARVDGDLVALDFGIQEGKELQDLLFEILTDGERQKFTTNRNLDKSYVFEGIGYFRVNIFMTRKGISAVLRAIPQKIPNPQDLGLPEAVVKLTEQAKGLVLVTGPTGSGKSTTLAALINHINTTYPYHILTAEDPVEFVHESKNSLINQREIGSSCPTFSDALKYALREDPDVILVGELRDLETISLALTAAETGHLVFGTLHTRGAAASIDRIIDSFPANQQAMIRTMLAESLIGVISQSLLKKIGGGRVAAYEIMIVNHAISNLIREGKTFQISSILQTGRGAGMVLMDQYILELVNKGLVSALEASAYMEDASLVMNKAGQSAGHSPTPSAPAKPPTAPQARPPSAPPGATKPPVAMPSLPQTPVKPASPAPAATIPKPPPAPAAGVRAPAPAPPPAPKPPAKGVLPPPNPAGKTETKLAPPSPVAQFKPLLADLAAEAEAIGGDETSTPESIETTNLTAYGAEIVVSEEVSSITSLASDPFEATQLNGNVPANKKAG